MLVLVLFEVRIGHAFSDAGREAHLITGLSLVIEIRSSLQETIDRVKEAVDAARCLLSYRKEQIVDLLFLSFTKFLCHLCEKLPSIYLN